MTLEQASSKARNSAERDGKRHCVLNLNTAGASLYVVREYQGPDAYAKESPRFVAYVTPNKETASALPAA